MGKSKNFLPLSAHVSFPILLLLALFLSGCYTVDQEIIGAQDASCVYNLPGPYSDINYPEQKTIISAVPDSNDYRFKRITREKTSTGYIRAIPLRDDIYIVQFKFDDEDVYYIDFYQFTSDKYYFPFEVRDYDALGALATQYNVTLDFDDVFGENYLSGSRENILAFLGAHSGLKMERVK
ncbi:MAG: hypothetical protein NTZ48_03265 [Candidatus Omnitrophica bacterium]|nr:hypothetical protein [Candidatus Omnitrophota bacterium]